MSFLTSPAFTTAVAALATALVSLVALAAGGTVLYFVTLLLNAALAARRNRRAAGTTGTTHKGGAPRFVVVVPAHNEELVLAGTLASLYRQDYPADRYQVVVVADNCTDTTAAIARQAGATVWERTDPVLRGKGYALDWAFSRLLAPDADSPMRAAEAYVIVDADTEVDPGFLRAMEARLWEGVPADSRGTHRRALQGRYGVLNPGDSWRAALMTAAFELVNHVKPLGRDRLGMSVGLKGNGMAFTRGVLETARWQGHSITEDIDYGLDLLVNHDIVVGYVPDAVVRAQMPVTAEQAASQRDRWERGRYLLLKERALPLLAAGLRRRRLRLLEAALDLMTPPLAELAALHLLWGGLTAGALSLGLLPGDARVWAALPVLSLLGFVAYTIGGLMVAGAPPAAYRALLCAPLYAPWKFALYAARFVRGRKRGGAGTSAVEWVRTERAPLAAGGAPATAAAPISSADRGEAASRKRL
jgi:Glycosyltransferases, probably involved in cell wall biogenesis